MKDFQQDVFDCEPSITALKNSLSAEQSDTTCWLTLHVSVVWLPSCTAPADVDLHVTAFPLQSPSVQTNTVFVSSWYAKNGPTSAAPRRYRTNSLSFSIDNLLGGACLGRALSSQTADRTCPGPRYKAIPRTSAKHRGLRSCQQLQHIALPTAGGSGTWFRTRFRTLDFKETCPHPVRRSHLLRRSRHHAILPMSQAYRSKRGMALSAAGSTRTWCTSHAPPLGTPCSILSFRRALFYHIPKPVIAQSEIFRRLHPHASLEPGMEERN